MEKGFLDSNISFSILFLDIIDEYRIYLFDFNCRICIGKMVFLGEFFRREIFFLFVFIIFM